jgi:hypothetical protein
MSLAHIALLAAVCFADAILLLRDLGSQMCKRIAGRREAGNTRL